MNGKIVVTGAAGFIGTSVTSEARQRGYEVAALDRTWRQTRQDRDEHVVEADIRDRETVFRAMKGAQYVIHLAAITSNVEFTKDPRHCYDVNVDGFATVVDAAARSGCEKLVYASSAAVYADKFSEDTTLDFRKQRNHYAKSKMMNEMVARSYEDVYGMKTIGLRYFNVYGHGENEKGDYASIITIFLRARSRGEALVVYGDGTQARDLIYVSDAARITLDLLERGEQDVYNVGTGVATAYKKIAGLIGGEIQYVRNPLSSYQEYTRAETGRLSGTLGPYAARGLDEGIEGMRISEERGGCLIGRRMKVTEVADGGGS